jgi:hypothetical protein
LRDAPELARPPASNAGIAQRSAGKSRTPTKAEKRAAREIGLEALRNSVVLPFND